VLSDYLSRAGYDIDTQHELERYVTLGVTVIDSSEHTVPCIGYEAETRRRRFVGGRETAEDLMEGLITSFDANSAQETYDSDLPITTRRGVTRDIDPSDTVPNTFDCQVHTL
jgi:hypothetical protein